MRKKKRLSPFDKNYAPYGTYEGPRGSEDEWAHAFKERLSPQEIQEIIGDDSPWGILGLQPGATQADIKSAFRRRAAETHPDKFPDGHPNKDGAAFRKVRAAYEQLTPTL